MRDINIKHLKVATFDNSSNNAVGALHQYFRVCQKEPELGDVCAIRVAGPEVYADVHCLVKFRIARAGEEYTVLQGEFVTKVISLWDNNNPVNDGEAIRIRQKDSPAIDHQFSWLSCHSSRILFTAF